MIIDLEHPCKIVDLPCELYFCHASDARLHSSTSRLLDSLSSASTRLRTSLPFQARGGRSFPEHPKNIPKSMSWSHGAARLSNG